MHARRSLLRHLDVSRIDAQLGDVERDGFAAGAVCLPPLRPALLQESERRLLVIRGLLHRMHACVTFLVTVVVVVVVAVAVLVAIVVDIDVVVLSAVVAV